MVIKKPTANITTNKSRVKIYDNKNVYLKDGDNFEFELFNPSQKTVMAVISIDGKKISNTGILVNAGQRIYLDRYLDVPNKFKFSTYKVEANNSDVDHAISKNGLVKVEFFDEQETKINYRTKISQEDYFLPKSNLRGGPTITTLGGSMDSDYYIPASLSGNATTTTLDNISSNQFYSNTSDHLGFAPLGDVQKSSFTASNSPLRSTFARTSSMKSFSEPEMKETGKIEAGGRSNQTFTTVHKNFNSWTSAVVEYKILPLSSQPIEIKDINHYCPSCGKKVKSKWKFCTKCGSVLD